VTHKKNNLKKPGGTSFAQKHLENICNSYRAGPCEEQGKSFKIE